jgi:hypothetical protein
MKPLLGLLKVKHVQKKHWCDNLGWDMVEVVHTIVMQTIKLALENDNVFILSFDEIISIDNNHGYQFINAPFRIRKRSPCCSLWNI